jgi:inosine-uridine nucleoside N-ribohydrolase
MTRKLGLVFLWILSIGTIHLSLTPATLYARSPSPTQKERPTPAEKVIIDTDIGDDIDDAFALALALKCPELNILQINSGFGLVSIRTAMLQRFLDEVGRADIPVATGVPSPMPESHFTQRRYGERDGLRRPAPDAIESTLSLIRKYPNEITLIAVGPMYNLAAMIDRDKDTFKKLKRVVIMGGSFYKRNGDFGFGKPQGPVAEWNIEQAVPEAQKLLAANVPLYMIPSDSTQLKFDEVNRQILFKLDTPLTDQLLILYQLWGRSTPLLHDAMTIAFIVKPDMCPVTEMHVTIDNEGFTRMGPGKPNTYVCLESDPEHFINFFMNRMLSNEAGSY